MFNKISFGNISQIQEGLLFLFLLPVAVFPRPSTILLLLLLPLGLWWFGRKQHHLLPSTPLNTPILLLLLMVIVSLIVTPDLQNSIGKVIGVVYGVGVYFAAVRYGSHHVWMLVGLHIMSAFGIIALGLLFGSWRIDIPLLSTVSARLPQPINVNQIAGVLLWIVPLPVGLLFVAIKQRLWRMSVFLITLILFFTAILLLTQSRGALLGLVGAIICMSLLLFVKETRYRLAGLIGMLVVGAITLALGGEQLLAGDTGAIFNSLQGRVELWSRGLSALRDFPITGMGMNTFRRVAPILYPPFLIAPDKDIAHAHNHLIQAGLDLGVIGLCAYLVLWVVCGHMLWQAWAQTTDNWRQGLIVGLAGCLLAHFIYGFLDAVSLGAKPGFIFWVLLGLVSVVYQTFTDAEAGADLLDNDS